MLFKSVVTSAFGMVYVLLFAPDIACPPSVLFFVFLYHWYLNVPSPVAFTVNDHSELWAQQE